MNSINPNSTVEMNCLTLNSGHSRMLYAFTAWDSVHIMDHNVNLGLVLARETWDAAQGLIEMASDMLTELIDPWNRTFTVGELNKDYGFPIVDLDEIDEKYF